MIPIPTALGVMPPPCSSGGLLAMKPIPAIQRPACASTCEKAQVSIHIVVLLKAGCLSLTTARLSHPLAMTGPSQTSYPSGSHWTPGELDYISTICSHLGLSIIRSPYFGVSRSIPVPVPWALDTGSGSTSPLGISFGGFTTRHWAPV